MCKKEQQQKSEANVFAAIELNTRSNIRIGTHRAIPHRGEIASLFET